MTEDLCRHYVTDISDAYAALHIVGALLVIWVLFF